MISLVVVVLIVFALFTKIIYWLNFDFYSKT